VLVQGLPKLAKMDLIVRQAAESGVARVIPLLALRSAARAEAEVRGRCERWRRIVREALQQSGSAVPTRIDEPVGLDLLPTVLGASRGRRICLLLDAEAPRPDAADDGLRGQTPSACGARRALEAPGSQSPPLALTSLHGYLTETPDEIVLCVGPEGGFAAEETRALAKAGFAPLRLPGAVLRTETAALFAVAAVEIILSERPSWIPRVP
jgi:16S rRNA (uracil1498-N3)-methyltransferase